MGGQDLEKRFEDAVKRVSDPNLKLAPDVRLAFYAYYKRAYGMSHPGFDVEDSSHEVLIKGFKMNALFQTRSLSVKQAKKKYIELADIYAPAKD